MSIVLKEDYVKGLEEYHKSLITVIEQNYNIKVDYLENTAWGLSSSVFYLKTNLGDYVARLCDYSKDRIETMTRDINLSTFLHGEFPTPEFITNNNSQFITEFQDILDKKRSVRLAKHIIGVVPFHMKYQYLKDALYYMKKLHFHVLPDPNNIKLPTITLDKSTQYLLHGDLTPMNFLISFEKVEGVLDFELSALGPMEWDLAKTILFSWFRIEGADFTEVFYTAVKYYMEHQVDFNLPSRKRTDIQTINLNTKLVHKYAIDHASSYLKNILKHKHEYDDNVKWQRDYDFCKSKLDELLRIKI